tara:strand:- start:108 stop:536 length:429 start_codon:yes stop_codon:yes gene_type:complete
MPNPKKEENLTPFKKGQTGNPKGRPPKLVSHITAELNAEGYTAVSKSNIMDAYLTLIQLPYEEIKAIASTKDKLKHPFLYKLVAKELTGKRGSDMLEKLLDRALGKATQNTDITSKGDKVGVAALTDEQLLSEIKKLKKDVK